MFFAAWLARKVVKILFGSLSSFGLLAILSTLCSTCSALARLAPKIVNALLDILAVAWLAQRVIKTLFDMSIVAWSAPKIGLKNSETVVYGIIKPWCLQAMLADVIRRSRQLTEFVLFELLSTWIDESKDTSFVCCFSVSWIQKSHQEPKPLLSMFICTDCEWRSSYLWLTPTYRCSCDWTADSWCGRLKSVLRDENDCEKLGGEN